MKQQRWFYFFGLCVAVLGSGCGGEEGPDPLDPSTFAGMNADKVQFDCQHTVQCAAQRGDELAQDPVNTCIRDTARELQANPDMQTLYLSNVNRCLDRVVCDYYECARQDAQGGYGQTQIEKVTYDCTQEVECRRVSNTLTGEPMMEVQSCVGNNLGYLDTFTTEMRAGYESAYLGCMGRVGCDFTTCFTW